MSYHREKRWVFWREEKRAEHVHAAEEDEKKDGFDGRSFERGSEVQSYKNNAEPRPQEEEEVGGLPAEEFAYQRGRKPISHVVDQHFDRSRFRCGVEDRPIVIDQVMQNGITPVMIPVLEGVAADAREEEPGASNE